MAAGDSTNKTPSIGTLRRRVLRADDDLLAATIDFRRELQVFERLMRQARAHIEAGGTVEELPRASDLPKLREDVTAASLRWERARHHARVETFRLAAAQGQSIGGIAREWGLSRQLVSRLAHEPDTRSRRNGAG